MSNDFHLDSIGQIHITVSDIDRAVEFYRDRLGMKFLFHVPGQSMAFLDCGGVRLYLGKAERPEFRSKPALYYRVESIAEAYESLISRGVDFDGEPHVVHRTEDYELWMAAFRDPDGNFAMLMSEAPVS